MFSDDNFFEIFSWLPAKPLIKFSSLNKTNHNLLKDPKFIQRHCHNWLNQNLNNNDDDDGYGFFIHPAYDVFKKPELHWLLSSSETRTAEVPNTSITFIRETFLVLASSNGLVLCRNKLSSELFLFNPATTSIIHIDVPEYTRTRLSRPNNITYPLQVAFFINQQGKKNSNSTNDYDLWVFEHETKEWKPYVEYKVYTFDQDGRVWRVKGMVQWSGRNILFERPPIYSNGEIFFVTNCGKSFTKSSPHYLPYILTFDVEKLTQRRIKLPRDAYRGFELAEMSLFPWEVDDQNSICLVRLKGLSLTVWVLEDVKRRKSWRRVARMKLKKLGLEDERISGYMVMRGWLIFTTANRVYKYKLIGKNSGEVCYLGRHKCGSRVWLDACVNTIRPCGDSEFTASIPTLSTAGLRRRRTRRRGRFHL